LLRFEIDTARPGYVHATLSGVFQLDSAKELFRAILGIAAARGEPKILLDCTRIGGEMTAQDRLEFGTYMASAQERVVARLPGGPRIAILAAPPIMDPGRFTQAVANNRGVRMRASDSLEELRSWLGV
jgi:hypothetical protein